MASTRNIQWLRDSALRLIDYVGSGERLETMSIDRKQATSNLLPCTFQSVKIIIIKIFHCYK